MEDLRRHLHELEQVTGGLADGFQAFLGKLAGLAGSLALILHMMTEPDHRRPVPREVVENTRRLVIDFILPHAFEFYRSADTVTDGDRIQRLASWILTSGKSRIVASDLASNIRDLRGLSVSDLNKRV